MAVSIIRPRPVTASIWPSLSGMYTCLAGQRMRRIEELHLDHPYPGSRMLRGLLLVEGYKLELLHVRTLMKRIRIEAIYRRLNTSKPAPGHKITPTF